MVCCLFPLILTQTRCLAAGCMRCTAPPQTQSEGRARMRPRPASSGARGTARVRRPRWKSCQPGRARTLRCPRQRHSPLGRA